MSGAPGGESAAGEHLKADPRRPERDFVTANFREFGLAEVRLLGLLGSSKLQVPLPTPRRGRIRRLNRGPEQTRQHIFELWPKERHTARMDRLHPDFSMRLDNSKKWPPGRCANHSPILGSRL